VSLQSLKPPVSGVYTSQRVGQPEFGSSRGKTSAKSALSFGRSCLALNSRTISGTRYGVPFERPTGHHTPRDVDPGQPFSGLERVPGLPVRLCKLHATGRERFVDHTLVLPQQVQRRLLGTRACERCP
jgi:hypothetical protein